jgi:GNAT superfamily N-acetyltransferase
MTLAIRIATVDDFEAMREVMRLSIELLQRGFQSPEAIAASHAVMGLDTQLVKDGTYFLVETDGQIAGCGGWSRRATLYGGDTSQVEREPRLLDPATEAARIRAMYTHPNFARRGAGRLILETAERAARAEGFGRMELMATLSGEPLYRASGYQVIRQVTDTVEGVYIPLLLMGKNLDADAAP